MHIFRAPVTRTLRTSIFPRASNQAAQLLRHNPRPNFLSFRTAILPTQLRTLASTTVTPPQPLPHRPAPHRNPDEPVYELTFTCKACRERSAHTVSKQGYHKGTVLITCPGCKARHLISDHLHIFSDSKITLEDIMKQKGESVQRGSIDAQGDIEFWSDKQPEQSKDDGKKHGGQD